MVNDIGAYERPKFGKHSYYKFSCTLNFQGKYYNWPIILMFTCKDHLHFFQGIFSLKSYRLFGWKGLLL